MKARWRLTVLLVLGFPGAASAQPSAPKPPTEIGALRGHFLSGTPDLAGVGVSLTAIEGLEIEAGYAPWVHRFQLFVPPDDSFHLRAGPRVTLWEDRDESGAGASLHISVRGGVRVWRTHEWTGWDTPSRSRTPIALSAAAALQGTIWLATRLGIQLELLAGANAWLTEAPPDIGAADLRASLGWAF